MDNAQEGAPISAIVISYFTGPILSRCISSLKQQAPIGEIILVDNGNMKGDIEKAIASDDDGAPVHVLSGHGNIGFAAACNLGAAKAKGEFLLFLNPDAIMPEDGAAQLLASSKALERPWLMGPKLVDPDGREQQGSRREVLTPWRAFVEAARLYKLAPQHPYFRRFNLHAHECPEDVIELPTLSGACFFLPKEDYDRIGGMDESYFLHVEDVDFCLRFAKADGRVYFNPHVDVVHFKSSSRANPIKIEARKTAGIIRYFNTHYSDAYPRPFLWLVAMTLWALFGVLFVRRGAAKLLRIVRLRLRSGSRATRLARRLFEKRSSR